MRASQEMRRPAVRIDVDQQIAPRLVSCALASNHQTLAGLVHNPHLRNGASDLGGPVPARVVDHDDLVGQAALRQERVQARRDEPFLVMGTDDDADDQSKLKRTGPVQQPCVGPFTAT